MNKNLQIKKIKKINNEYAKQKLKNKNKKKKKNRTKRITQKKTTESTSMYGQQHIINN